MTDKLTRQRAQNDRHPLGPSRLQNLTEGRRQHLVFIQHWWERQKKVEAGWFC